MPGGIVRPGTYLGAGSRLKVCLVNIGAYIGDNTRIANGTKVGMGAQIGSNVTISQSVHIVDALGVFRTQPQRHFPVIIKDNCYIGPTCVLGPGVMMEQGGVLGNGVTLDGNTYIEDLVSGRSYFGSRIPEGAVVKMKLHGGQNIFVPQIVGYRKKGEAAQAALKRLT